MILTSQLCFGEGPTTPAQKDWIFNPPAGDSANWDTNISPNIWVDLFDANMEFDISYGEPTIADIATIGAKRTAVLNTPGKKVNHLSLAGSHIEAGTLNIENGGSLTVAGLTKLAAPATGYEQTRGGILNLTGGMIETQGIVLLGAADQLHISHHGTVNIHGGEWISRNQVFLSSPEATHAGIVNMKGGTWSPKQTVSLSAENGAGGEINLYGGEINANPNTPIAFDLGTNAVINIDGGTLSAHVHQENGVMLARGGTVNLKLGYIVAHGADGPNDAICLKDSILNISGGEVSLTKGQIFTFEPTINIHGDEASIRMDGISSLPGKLTSKWNFIFNATGVSTVDSANSFINLSGATVNVDGSYFEGRAGRFKLFDSRNDAAFKEPAHLKTVGFDNFYTKFSTLDGDLYLTIIPRGGKHKELTQASAD